MLTFPLTGPFQSPPTRGDVNDAFAKLDDLDAVAAQARADNNSAQDALFNAVSVEAMRAITAQLEIKRLAALRDASAKAYTEAAAKASRMAADADTVWNAYKASRSAVQSNPTPTTI